MEDDASIENQQNVFANCLKEILQSEQVYCSLLRGLNFQRQCISFLINGLNGGSTRARCSELSWQTVTMSHVVTTYPAQRSRGGSSATTRLLSMFQCSCNSPTAAAIAVMLVSIVAQSRAPPSCSGCSVLCILINPNDHSVCTCIALLLTIDTSASYC